MPFWIRVEASSRVVSWSVEADTPFKAVCIWVRAALTWSAKDVKAAYEAMEEAGEGGSVVLEHIFTFEGLELYAPNGSKYEYTVTEVKDNFLEGYETSWGNDDLEIESPTFQSGSEATPLSPTPVAEDPGAGGGEDVPDPGEAAPTDPAEEPEYVIAATFKNVPDTRTVVLEGKKTWKDFDNSFDLRPLSLIHI